MEREESERERKNERKVRILCGRNNSQPSFFLLICVLVWSTFISLLSPFTLFSPRLLCPHPLSPTLWSKSCPNLFPNSPSFLIPSLSIQFLPSFEEKEFLFFSLLFQAFSKSWPFFSKCESCRSSSLQLFPSPFLLEPMDKQVGSFFSWTD